MIVDQIQYAGDTQIASSLVVEQTGPLQLTVRAGTFTTAHGVSHVLAADVVLNLSADATLDKCYIAEIGLYQGVPSILCRSQLAGEHMPNEPAGWQGVHYLINAFTLPAGATSLDALIIPVYATRAGFPPNEGISWGRLPDGSLWQKGMA